MHCSEKCPNLDQTQNSKTELWKVQNLRSTSVRGLYDIRTNIPPLSSTYLVRVRWQQVTMVIQIFYPAAFSSFSWRILRLSPNHMRCILSNRYWVFSCLSFSMGWETSRGRQEPSSPDARTNSAVFLLLRLRPTFKGGKFHPLVFATSVVPIPRSPDYRWEWTWTGRWKLFTTKVQHAAADYHCFRPVHGTKSSMSSWLLDITEFAFSLQSGLWHPWTWSRNLRTAVISRIPHLVITATVIMQMLKSMKGWSGRGSFTRVLKVFWPKSGLWYWILVNCWPFDWQFTP